jgi:hypothetical protein
LTVRCDEQFGHGLTFLDFLVKLLHTLTDDAGQRREHIFVSTARSAAGTNFNRSPAGADCTARTRSRGCARSPSPAKRASAERLAASPSAQHPVMELDDEDRKTVRDLGAALEHAPFRTFDVDLEHEGRVAWRREFVYRERCRSTRSTPRVWFKRPIRPRLDRLTGGRRARRLARRAPGRHLKPATFCSSSATLYASGFDGDHHHRLRKFLGEPDRRCTDVRAGVDNQRPLARFVL